MVRLKISVILVVQNGEKYLKTAIESVINQSYKPDEIIVVDGNSTDQTAEIANSYNQVSYIKQSETGLANARNTGILYASGDLIAFLDHADVWVANKLKSQFIHFRKNPKLGYCYARLKLFLEPGNKLRFGYTKSDLDKSKEGRTPGTLMVRKSLFQQVGEFKTEYRIGCDIEWFTRVKNLGIPFVSLSDILLLKRIHDSNLSNDVETNRIEIIKIIKQSLHYQRNKKPLVIPVMEQKFIALIKILHIIDALSASGPTRSLLTAAKTAARKGLNQQHTVISLNDKAYPPALFQAKRNGIEIIRKPAKKLLFEKIECADIVQLHFWNRPDIYEFLHMEKPKMRLLLWFKILGDKPPQVITKDLLEYTDFALATSPSTLQLPVFKNIAQDRVHVVYGMSDWDRLENIQIKPHKNFNVGYIGTVNFGKMHPHFVPMSNAIEIPGVKFHVVGNGLQKELKAQAQEIDALEKFEFHGYVENIKPILESLDVFGYPLCEDTYATSEKSLQEAMYAGVPPVVFPYGGVKNLVQNHQTGLIVNSPLEYKNAIEFLYNNVDERKRLGENAREYAQKTFNNERWVKRLHSVYEGMMTFPKLKRAWKIDFENVDNTTAAQFFLQSLSGLAPQFQKSYSGGDLTEQLASASEIAKSSALLAGGEGGIMQYRNQYPDDPHLRFWSGLILKQQRKYSIAYSEFTAATELGYKHSGVYWYLAKTALKLNNFHAARKAMIHVTDLEPEFANVNEQLYENKR